MRSRRPSPDHAEAVARRLALLSAELDAARRQADPAEDRPLGELTRVAGAAVPFEEHLRPSPSLTPPSAAPTAELAVEPPTAPEQVLPVPGRHAARRRRPPRRTLGVPGSRATQRDVLQSGEPEAPGSVRSRVRDVGAWAPAQVSVLLAGVALALAVT